LLWLAQAAAPAMRAVGAGKLIAISSHGSLRAFANYGAIGASKAALESLVRHLAFELGPGGININCVLSGMIATDAVKTLPGHDEILAATQNLVLTARRAIEPSDIASAVAFLASSRSDMIQGQTLIVDGGISIRV
jgi:enoyl-[acyl-carrier protein] reductase III